MIFKSKKILRIKKERAKKLKNNLKMFVKDYNKILKKKLKYNNQFNKNQ